MTAFRAVQQYNFPHTAYKDDRLMEKFMLLGTLHFSTISSFVQTAGHGIGISTEAERLRQILSGSLQ